MRTLKRDRIWSMSLVSLGNHLIHIFVRLGFAFSLFSISRDHIFLDLLTPKKWTPASWEWELEQRMSNPTKPNPVNPAKPKDNPNYQEDQEDEELNKDKEAGPISASGYTKLLVTSAMNRVDKTVHYQNASEVIDLEDPMSRCDNLGPYQNPNASHATGALLNDVPFICGGGSLSKREYYDTCHTPGSKETLAVMSSPRRGAASIVITDKLAGTNVNRLFVTGGTRDIGPASIETTTEFVLQDQTATIRGPDLPMALTFHCLIQVNSSTSMLIGGSSNNIHKSDKAFYYNAKPMSWELVGSRLRQGRFFHSCGKVLKDGKHVIVAAGGYVDNEKRGSRSTEIIRIGNGGGGEEFQPGPDLPRRIRAAAGITDGQGRFLVVGGIDESKDASSKLIYALQSRNQDLTWSTLIQELSTGWHANVVMLIPDALVTCRKSNAGEKTAKPTLTKNQNKILVTAGMHKNWPTVRPLNTSEVIDLEDPLSHCDNLGEYPDPSASYATGALLNDSPFICGGGNRTRRDFRDTCHAPGTNATLAVMSTPRRGAASVVILHDGENRLFVTGGESRRIGKKGILSSTELVTANQTSSIVGPDLPYPVRYHCLLTVNSSSLMLIGGETTIGPSFYLVFNLTSFTWTIGRSSLRQRRSNHACGKVKDENATDPDNVVIVAVGGKVENLTSKGVIGNATTEILATGGDAAEGFQEGPVFPMLIRGASGITDNRGRFLLVGGYNKETETSQKSIYALTLRNQELTWSKLEQELSTGRHAQVVMLIPEVLTTCSRRQKPSRIGEYNPLCIVTHLIQVMVNLTETEVDNHSLTIKEDESYTKVMVTAGFYRVNWDWKFDNTTEVIDIDNTMSTCQTNGSYPKLKATSFTGGLLSGSLPLVCLGFQNQMTCHTPGNKTTLATMTIPRKGAASVVIVDDGHDSLFITGGSRRKDQDLVDSTEFVSPQHPSTTGPVIPFPVKNHCLVPVNSSASLLIGGQDAKKKPFQNTVVLSTETKTLSWQLGQVKLQHGRSHHSCGKVKDHNGGLIIVVCGGLDETKRETSSCEMLTSLDNNAFELGPELPTPIRSGAGITHVKHGRFLMVGGKKKWAHQDYYGPIFALESNSNGQLEWTKMEQELSTIARHAHVAMLIPDSLAICN